MKEMKKILLIITGSIAAYKNIDLIRDMESLGYSVSVILTNSAKHFISETAILATSHCKIYSDDVFKDAMLHINLARTHDVILIAPASANFIAKAASGMADSLSLAVILAANIPVFFCPAMNPSMYNNAATLCNISTLKERSYKILGPVYGKMACNEEGLGKYISATEIIKYIDESLTKPVNKKVVILLGSTREKIDPVRYISNYSSGKTGLAIADELTTRGFEVKIIAGFVETEIKHPAVRAYSANEMLSAVINELPADIVICLAAICDYRPVNYSEQKIKKETDNFTLELEKNVDVITEISKHENRPEIVIGFALESNNFEDNARKKLNKKKLDMIILNQSNYLGSNQNQYTLYTKNDHLNFGLISKNDFASKFAEYLLHKII
jgi:phosphopantothenoylcysteine decarboxylase/phosphopantothenate--cysteine ligase